MRLLPGAGVSVQPERCPACGQLLINYLSELAPTQQKLFEYVANNPRGVTRKQCQDHLYWDRPDGGPDNPGIISVMANQINKKIAKYGLQITAEKRRLYKLLPLA